MDRIFDRRLQKRMINFICLQIKSSSFRLFHFRDTPFLHHITVRSSSNHTVQKSNRLINIHQILLQAQHFSCHRLEFDNINMCQKTDIIHQDIGNIPFHPAAANHKPASPAKFSELALFFLHPVEICLQFLNFHSGYRLRKTDHPHNKCK